MSNTHENSTLCHRYATALLELASEHKCVEESAKDLQSLQESLAQSPELREALRNPSYDKKQLGAAMQEILGELKANDLTKKFINLLSVKNRLPVLHDIIGAFLKELGKLRGEVRADITTATKLSSDEEDKLLTALHQSVSKKITINTHIDESLIGGFIVRVGSKMIDASTRTQLLTLANNMKG